MNHVLCMSQSLLKNVVWWLYTEFGKVHWQRKAELGETCRWCVGVGTLPSIPILFRFCHFWRLRDAKSQAFWKPCPFFKYTVCTLKENLDFCQVCNTVTICLFFFFFKLNTSYTLKSLWTMVTLVLSIWDFQISLLCWEASIYSTALWKKQGTNGWSQIY